MIAIAAEATGCAFLFADMFLMELITVYAYRQELGVLQCLLHLKQY